MLIFLYGEDDFRLKEKLKDLTNQFKKKVDLNNFSIEEINISDLKLNEFYQKINTSSLFTEKRLVIVKDLFNKEDENLFKELNLNIKKLSENKELILVFINQKVIENKLKKEAKTTFKLLKSQKFSQEFKNLNEKQLFEFAKNKFTLKNQRITNSALSQLLIKTGNDLYRLNNEINKLSSLKKNEIIEIKDIDENICGDFEEKIFALIDSFFSKRKSDAYLLLNEQFKAGLSSEYILSMLIRQIKILLEIKSAQKTLSAKEIPQKLNLHPFVVKKSLSQVSQYQLKTLKEVLDKLINLDYKNKKGDIDLKNELLLISAKGLIF